MEELIYKGYTASVHYSPEDKTLYGQLDGIKDIVTFEFDSAAEVEEKFRKAVDDYIEMKKTVEKW